MAPRAERTSVGTSVGLLVLASSLGMATAARSVRSARYLGDADSASLDDAAVRGNVSGLSEANASSMTEVKSDLCGSSILFEYQYHDGKGELEVSGAFKLGPYKWFNTKILQKTDGDGCVKTYYARCATGKMVVSRLCANKATAEEDDERSLSGMFRSRNTDVASGERLVLVAGDAAGTVLDAETLGGRVEWAVVDDAPILTLTSISNRRGRWNADAGCYCCKKNWNSYNILEDPFGVYGAGGGPREAYSGDTCMLAWALQGKDQDMGAFLGTSLYQVLNMFTLGITQRAACLSTCPFRGEEWAENKYAYSRTFS